MISMLQGGKRKTIEVADHATADTHPHPAGYTTRTGGVAGLANPPGTARAHETADSSKGTTQGVYSWIFQACKILFFFAEIETDRRRRLCVSSRGLE